MPPPPCFSFHLPADCILRNCFEAADHPLRVADGRFLFYLDFLFLERKRERESSRPAEQNKWLSFRQEAEFGGHFLPDCHLGLAEGQEPHWLCQDARKLPWGAKGLLARLRQRIFWLRAAHQPPRGPRRANCQPLGKRGCTPRQCACQAEQRMPAPFLSCPGWVAWRSRGAFLKMGQGDHAVSPTAGLRWAWMDFRPSLGPSGPAWLRGQLPEVKEHLNQNSFAGRGASCALSAHLGLAGRLGGGGATPSSDTRAFQTAPPHPRSPEPGHPQEGCPSNA